MLSEDALLEDAGQSDLVRQALAEYQTVFDNAIVGICYTRHRIISRCNRRFEEMFGYAPGELNGQSARILYPSEAAYQRIGQAGYGHLITHRTYSDERAMRRKSGELFWCTVGGRRLDAKNPVSRGIWIFQDITKRRTAEEALQKANERLEQRVMERTAELRKANQALREQIARREKTEEELLASREKYRVLFETFPIGISITDDQGQVIEVNRALHGFSSRQAQAMLMRDLRTPDAELVHPDGSLPSKEDLPSERATRLNRAISDVELGLRYRDGRMRWFCVSAAPIPVKGYGAVVAQAEITERKRIQEQERQQRVELAHISRLNTMGEMAAALAHELGQPLSSTLNYLHGCQLRLDDGEGDPALLRSAMTQAIAHVERAGDILKHIRHFVRRHEPETVSTCLNALATEMVCFLDFERRQHEAQVRLNLDPKLPKVMMDPVEIKQVVLNLIKNGFEAMDEVPVQQRLLEVNSRRHQDGWIQLCVADRGPGVENKMLTQIFDPFYTTKRNGIGLGLAICRSVIESHGGQLKAERNVHGGASFRFTLPVDR
ncbi:MAG: PAS domain-containing sensor histidine kinase [Panacagrimonas sp.]